jgi:hypothetical protein
MPHAWLVDHDLVKSSNSEVNNTALADLYYWRKDMMIDRVTGLRSIQPNAKRYRYTQLVIFSSLSHVGAVIFMVISPLISKCNLHEKCQ